MERKSHWETVYGTKAPTEVSWFQEHPHKSLELIKATGVGPEGQILDAGGGASTLVDHLLQQGFRLVTVLDIAAKSLEAAKARLGQRGNSIIWLEADVTVAVLPRDSYDIWHDRAVFHFLTDSADRQRYVALMKSAVK